MKDSDKLFFDILRKGLWGESYAKINYSTDAEVWKAILDLGFSQTVAGIVADGLSNCPQGVVPSEVAREIISASISTEQLNERMNAAIAQLMPAFDRADVPAVVVKGQAIAQCYRHPLSRTPGDIDLIVKCEDYERAKAVVQELSGNEGVCTPEVKHFAVTFGDVEVEVHGTIHTNLEAGINNILDIMQADLFMDGGSRLWDCNGAKVQIPSEDFNALYIFVHFLQHFFFGGMGLRQLCDLTMALHSGRGRIDEQKLSERLKSMKLETEWKTLVAFLVEYLGLPEQEAPFFDKTYCSKTHRVWKNLRNTGNFGRGKPRRYGAKSPYLLRKSESFIRYISNLPDRVLLFPGNSLKTFRRFFSRGLKAVSQGK